MGYEAKFGMDVDSEEKEKDGVMWAVTRGIPPSISQLEAGLSDVKALYEAKFGNDVHTEDGEDDEGSVEKAGVRWTVTRGAPPSMSQLEDSLLDVKAMYEMKFGESVDSEDKKADEGSDETDGVMWTVNRGAPPSISQLEKSLFAVKALYEAKYGEHVCAEEEGR